MSSLSWLLAVQGRREEAGRELVKAIESETNPATRAYYNGLLLIRLYPNDRARLLEARANLEEALRLQAGFALAAGLLADLEHLLQSTQ